MTFIDLHPYVDRDKALRAAVRSRSAHRVEAVLENIPSNYDDVEPAFLQAAQLGAYDIIVLLAEYYPISEWELNEAMHRTTADIGFFLYEYSEREGIRFPGFALHSLIENAIKHDRFDIASRAIDRLIREGWGMRFALDGIVNRLYEMINSGNREVADAILILIEKLGIDLSGDERQRILKLAIPNNNSTLVRKMIADGQRIRKAIFNDAIQFSASNKYREMLEVLLDAADHFKFKIDSYKIFFDTADRDIIRLALEYAVKRGDKIRAVDFKSGIRAAVVAGSLESAQLLLEAALARYKPRYLDLKGSLLIAEPNREMFDLLRSYLE